MSAKTPSLTAESVRHIAALAQLALTDDEVAMFGRQLGDILTYAADVQSVDTSDVPPTSHAHVPDAAWRDDEPAPSLSRDAILANAPDAHTQPTLFRVPRVIG